MRRLQRADGISIDLIALPLLFCLLAAVVGLFALDEATSSPCCAPPEQRAAELRRLVGQAEELGTQQTTMIRRLDYAITERDLSQKANETASARERASLVALVAQVTEAERHIAELQSELSRYSPAASARPEDSGLGNYTGPYVLLDCKNGYAIVYPGSWRIPSEPSGSELTRLMSQLRQAGFVAMGVRPSGWFNNSFDKLRKQIIQEIGSTNIGRTEFPLSENEPIKPYLPG